MHGEIKRTTITNSIHFLLDKFPCIAILGARQVGKTTLLKQLFPNSPFFDLEKQADFQRIQQDPDFFLSQYDETIVIDEAQIMPALFPALRVKIDSQRHKNGQFLLSGSSSPELLSQINESLAGRIAVFELEGFSLEERMHTTHNPLYQYLANTNFEDILQLQPQLPPKDVLRFCLLGSYPEPTLKHVNDRKSFQLWMDNYFASYIQRDIRKLFPGLQIQTYQRFIAMLAGASAEVINISDFAKSLDISQPTAKSYFDIAHGSFFWRILPSFHKNIKKRVIKMPKGYLRDSGLLNYFLRNTTIEQLQTHYLYGRIWESFIIEEIIKGFQNNLISVKPYFYRTSNKAEIDLILEGDFGILPIEIKAGTITKKRTLLLLQDFIKEHQLPFGIVINQATELCWLTKKILQIPAHFL